MGKVLEKERGGGRDSTWGVERGDSRIGTGTGEGRRKSSGRGREREREGDMGQTSSQ